MKAWNVTRSKRSGAMLTSVRGVYKILNWALGVKPDRQYTDLGIIIFNDLLQLDPTGSYTIPQFSNFTSKQM